MWTTLSLSLAQAHSAELGTLYTGTLYVGNTVNFTLAPFTVEIL